MKNTLAAPEFKWGRILRTVVLADAPSPTVADGWKREKLLKMIQLQETEHGVFGFLHSRTILFLKIT